MVPGLAVDPYCGHQTATQTTATIVPRNQADGIDTVNVTGICSPQSERWTLPPISIRRRQGFLDTRKEFRCQGPSIVQNSMLFARAVGVHGDTLAQPFSWLHSIPKMAVNVPEPSPSDDPVSCWCFLPCSNMSHRAHLYTYLYGKVAFPLDRLLDMEKYKCIPFIIVQVNISCILWMSKDVLNISKQRFKQFFKHCGKIHIT